MELLRTNQTELTFTGEKDKEYEIYFENQCIAKGFGKVTFEDVDSRKQNIYQLKSESGIQYISERLLALTGVVNFRDLGGYYTKDHRQVKYGCFYRSAPLAHLNSTQHQYIQNLHLKHILDLRSGAEIKGNEDETFDGCIYHQISGIKEMEKDFNGNFDFAELMKSGNFNVLGNYLSETYKTLPIENEAYIEMFKMLEAHETPIVFHCSAGKDRTGVAAALILLMLGVDEKTVMEDYLLSNVYRQEENEKILSGVKEYRPILEKMIMVYDTYLLNALNAIKNKYGTYETYFEKEFGLTEDKIAYLRNLYLYEA